MDDHSSKRGITSTPLAANPNLLSQSDPAVLSLKRSNRNKVPIRHCSRWGLPCGCCYQPPGGLLPHPFTLTCASTGGLLSVALSIELPRPGVTRHRCFVESGLSSRRRRPAVIQLPAIKRVKAFFALGQWKKPLRGDPSKHSQLTPMDLNGREKTGDEQRLKLRIIHSIYRILKAQHF